MPRPPRVVYSPSYSINIGPHVWPTTKYERIARHLTDAGIVSPDFFVAPEPCAWEELALVHTPDYLDKVRTGRLTDAEIAQLEVPWSEEIRDGFRLMVGGTIAAGRLAIAHATGVHLGGGLHHAFPNHGEGFCMFNDVAVAVRCLQRDGAIERAAVIDCDVHQGNGTAVIFHGDPTVFTFSIHQQHNYPAWKPPSDLDVGLPDGTGDARYLSALAEALPVALAGRPSLVFYLAGADPFEEDQLGGLRVTKKGLRSRDRLVLEAARHAHAAVCVVLAGGYARRIEDTVDIHVATVEECLKE